MRNSEYFERIKYYFKILLVPYIASIPQFLVIYLATYRFIMLIILSSLLAVFISSNTFTVYVDYGIKSVII